MAEIDEIKEIGKKVTSYAESVTAVQKQIDEMQKNAQKQGDDFKALEDGTVQKAADAAAQALQEAQELKQKLEATDKTAQYIEKAMSRMGSGDGDSEAKEMEAKAADQTARYLRSGQLMDADVVEAVVKGLHEKAFHGISESKRDVELKDLVAGSNPDGGYFIRPERSATMIKRIFETSAMRSVANIETTSSDALEFVIDDDEADSGGWVGEVDARSNTGTPKVGLLTIPAHEQFAQPKATQKMLDDAGFDIESWLSGKVTRKMTRVENTAFVVGDGAEKPRGFLNYPNWAAPGTYQRKAIEQIASGAAADFTGDGIKALQNSMIEDYQANAKFALQRSSWVNITTLKDNDDRYLLETDSLKMGDTKVLLGKEVMFMHDIPLVAADALAMVYADFGTAYTIVDRIGFRVIRDIYTQKPYILFYTTKRTGGDVTNYEAMKIQVISV